MVSFCIYPLVYADFIQSMWTVHYLWKKTNCEDQLHYKSSNEVCNIAGCLEDHIWYMVFKSDQLLIDLPHMSVCDCTFPASPVHQHLALSPTVPSPLPVTWFFLCHYNKTRSGKSISNIYKMFCYSWRNPSDIHHVLERPGILIHYKK